VIKPNVLITYYNNLVFETMIMRTEYNCNEIMGSGLERMNSCDMREISLYFCKTFENVHLTFENSTNVNKKKILGRHKFSYKTFL